MIKYRGSLNVSIFTKINSRFIKTATVRPYTQESKNSKNGGVPCKHLYFENTFYILLSFFILNDEYNYNVGTDKIIRIMLNNHSFNMYFIHYSISRFMSSNSSLWIVFLIIDESNYKFAKLSIKQF